MVFLGFQLDTVNNTISIPMDKVKDYLQTISECAYAKKITLRKLKSIIGKLQFCSTIVPGGRCFLRRLYDRTLGVTKPSSSIKVTKGMAEDLGTWRRFLLEFDGKEIIDRLLCHNSPYVTMTSDSSKSGYGGTLGSECVCSRVGGKS